MAGLSVYEVNNSGTRKLKVVNVTFDDSYTTGGLALTPAQCGLSGIDVVIPEHPVGYSVQYVAGKLVVRYATTAHTHVTNAAATYTQSEVSAASTATAGTQVANTTDLSALQVRLLVVGTP